MIRLASVLVVVAALSGCGDDAAACMVPLERPDPTLSLTIGSATEAWTDGQRVPLVSGGQGGVMLLPVVRLPAGDLDEICALVSVSNRTTVEEADPGTDRLLVFRREGDELVSPVIEDFLGYSPSPFVDQEITLEVTVIEQESAFAASGEVTVVIAPPS